MKILNFKGFKKKHNLEKTTVNESELQRVSNYTKYPRDYKVYSNLAFVDIDNGSTGGSHWTCFIVKDNKFFYFGSFGGQPYIFLLNQLPKPIVYHNYNIQDINFKICGS